MKVDKLLIFGSYQSVNPWDLADAYSFHSILSHFYGTKSTLVSLFDISKAQYSDIRPALVVQLGFLVFFNNHPFVIS